MGTVTQYGKILRHIRIDSSELLANMAQKLNVSPAYLSSIETGQRAIPSNLTEKIIALYNLPAEVREELMRAEISSNEAITINLNGATSDQIDATVLFAREVKNMKVKELRELINKLRNQ